MTVRRSEFLLLSVLIGCASSTPAARTPASGNVNEPIPPADVEMRYHFWDVAQARDAVIQADLEGVRAPLLRVADAPYGDDLPLDWQPWVKEMQQQARAGAQSKTLAEAAQSVAMISNTCGECHRTTRGGLHIADDAADYRPKGEGLPERMHKHMWAADALWVGLTGKNHQAWSRGARALAELPLPEPVAVPEEDTEESGAAAPSTDAAAEAQPAAETADEESEDEPAQLSPFDEKLDAIRLLGQRADEAGQPTEKADVYGQILTACAECHALVRQHRIAPTP